jgi:predicted DNA-binding protein (UPF0278 family)
VLDLEKELDRKQETKRKAVRERVISAARRRYREQMRESVLDR